MIFGLDTHFQDLLDAQVKNPRDVTSVRTGSAAPGEAWHSDDRQRGGLMRECGFPAWQVIGLETFGILTFSGPPAPGVPGDGAFGTYDVTDPGHFLFHGLGVTAGQEFSIKMVGHESDVRLSTLEALRTKPLPPGATDPIEPPGITTLATGHQNTCCALFPFDYFLHELPAMDPVAEVIYWERPDGGRVFNGGAIGNGIALLADETFAGLVRN